MEHPQDVFEVLGSDGSATFQSEPEILTEDIYHTWKY